MDPLSITASILAIITASEKTVKGLAKLRSFKHAVTEFSALINEVSDLRLILTQVGLLGAQLEQDLNEGPVIALRSLLRRAEQQVQDLEEYVQYDLSKPDVDAPGGVKVKKKSWALHQEKLLNIQQGIKTTRLNLGTALGVVTSSTMNRVELRIQQVVSSQEADSKLLQRIFEQSTAISQSLPGAQPDWNMLQRLLTQAGAIPNRASDGADSTTSLFPNSSTSRLIDHRVSPTRHYEAQVGHMATVQIKAQAQVYRRRCRPWCSCSCHKKTTFRYPKLVRNVIGNLFVGYTGMPGLTASCNEMACQQRSAASVEVTYYFPSWLLSRMLSLTLTLTAFGGPELNLRMPRMVNWTTPLWRLSTVGESDQIGRLFSTAKASPYDVNAYGQSALHYAVGYRHVELCQFLIRSGADMNLQDENGKKPIDSAWDIALSNTATNVVVEAFTQLFSDGEYLETRQFTPLHKSILGLSRTAVITMLDDSTARVNISDANGRTPLSWAASRGDHQALEALLNSGADTRIVDMEGSTPLIYAVESGDAQCVSTLIAHGADLGATNVFGATALQLACKSSRDTGILAMLIDHHIDINAIDFDGDTALNSATRHCHTHNALFLLQAGADPDIANVAGETAVHMAIYYFAYDILAELVRRKVNLAVINSRGCTLLHALASHYDARMLGILEAADLGHVDVDKVDVDGRTCWDELARQGDGDVEKMKRGFATFLNRIRGRV
ncbi:uncharacterized protein EKO05_0010889 [Ascochyta rabiei]|uniref:Uncharacterized protein n=1 Tax=Didymella rabiei TaxID=5454 RepID=A0A162ZI50_DIDRA|nr:uncharacterized protein EKO05_0010889 [Ascochyta rabiei]KZM20612.1 hypothetical protein ST47_g8211 [Ascochyta rabiei]UPX20663.1 hypothetical protein EKO05_0010889 [Ascochyta rabiei]